MKTTTAVCFRTAMCGGGTSYEVYFRAQDKPSHPLHGGHIYATTIGRGKGEYFTILDAIDPRARWEMEQGLEKWEAGKVLEARAKRLAVRIAKRAFPELRGRRELPFLWAGWNQPSATVNVPVRIELPD
jgi:galactokinase/mevalonate kinase-like predicted kinase